MPSNIKICWHYISAVFQDQTLILMHKKGTRQQTTGDYTTYKISQEINEFEF